MSCTGLRLLPTRKAWKSFTSKLQTRLHKLHTSKPFKRAKTRHKHSKAGRRSSSFLYQQQRHQRKKGCFSLTPSNSFSFPFRRHRLIFQKKPAPVYIDKLYKAPVTDLVECVQPPSKNVVKLPDSASEAPGTSKGGTKDLEKASLSVEADEPAADAMWESLGLASPQETGIDERAEAFIATFRAEMERQESMARDNL